MDFLKITRVAHQRLSAALFVLSALGTLVVPSLVRAEIFTVALMPDPQYYTVSNHESVFDLYRKQSNWLVANRNAHNIKHVLWLGDLTNDNTLAQWQIADRAYKILDNANIPYAVCPGNHDYKTPGKKWTGANFRDLGLYNAVVGPNRFSGKSFYGGNMGETPNQNENNYTFFSAGGMDFMVVSLEFTPRKDALTWANNLISQHPDKRVIIMTHAYLTSNGKYSGGGGSQAGTVGASGAEIFEEVAKRHSNVFLVVCGHVGDSEKNYKTGIAGNAVTEMLVDYQFETVKGTGANLGNGWLRLLTFNTATNKIQARTITVVPDDPSVFQDGITRFYRNTYKSDVNSSDHQYDFTYNMGPMQPYTYMNSSLEFHQRALGTDLRADQQGATIAQADNGDWVGVWAEDSDKNGIYQIQVRGFDFDGNERFESRVVNTFGINTQNTSQPAVAMTPDGRFVVVWVSGNNAIKSRVFTAAGMPMGALEQNVASVGSSTQISGLNVAVENNGQFVVAWTEATAGSRQVKWQAFNSNGTIRLPQTAASLTPNGAQHSPSLAMAANGNFVVAWQDNSGTHSSIRMRGFLSNGNEMFSERFGTSITDGEQSAPAIAMDRSTGRFVVAWEDDADLNTFYQIKARGYEANGSQRFPELTVNIKATDNQLKPAVSMDTYGKWYIAWEDNGQGGSGHQIMANMFDINGNRLVTTDTRVNPVISVDNNFGPAVRRAPVISGHKSGRYLVAWSDDMDGNGDFQGLARGVAGTGRSLAVAGTHGSVTKTPDQPFYQSSDSVKLTPVAQPGYVFSKWMGDVPSSQQTANPLTVTTNTNKAIRALFVPTAAVNDWGLY